MAASYFPSQRPQEGWCCVCSESLGRREERIKQKEMYQVQMKQPKLVINMEMGPAMKENKIKRKLFRSHVKTVRRICNKECLNMTFAFPISNWNNQL
jgi:phosphoribosyl-dephospho-CoA transferase